jgi:hypothetical protein
MSPTLSELDEVESGRRIHALMRALRICSLKGFST